MAAHAGETARETGEFRSARRNEQVHMTRGESTTRPNCGNDGFDRRHDEAGTTSP